MVCQGSLGVRGRGVPAIISPKPIGTLRKRMGLGNYAPYVGRLAKITRGNLDNKCIADGGAGHAHHAFLDSSKFDPETNRVMAVAFDMACAALQLGDRSNLINERIAKRIIELAKTGELNPDLLCESVLKEFRQHL